MKRSRRQAKIKMDTKVKIKCNRCGKPGYHPAHRIRMGLGKFCSKKCSQLNQKGRKYPHSKQHELNRMRAIRKAFKNKIWPRGYKRPKAHTSPMRKALIAARDKNPEKFRSLSIKNLPKNCKKEKNGNWRGGLAAKASMARNTQELRQWRKNVFKRDGGKCKLCGSKKRLQVHHIVPFCEHPELGDVMMNGVLLCKRCHFKNDIYWQGQRFVKKHIPNIIEIHPIPSDFHVYPTAGNWIFTKHGTLVVFASHFKNPIHTFLVALHEMVEATICKIDGISTEQVDDWDCDYEKNRKPGDNSEPGEHKLCPYRRAHLAALRVEMLAAVELGVDWIKYEDALNKTV